MENQNRVSCDNQSSYEALLASLLTHVSEDVPFACAVEDGQDAGCRATRTSADLQGDNAAPDEQHFKHRLDCCHDAHVVEGAAHSVLVNGQHRFHGSAGKEELMVTNCT